MLLDHVDGVTVNGELHDHNVLTASRIYSYGVIERLLLINL